MISFLFNDNIHNIGKRNANEYNRTTQLVGEVDTLTDFSPAYTKK